MEGIQEEKAQLISFIQISIFFKNSDILTMLYHRESFGLFKLSENKLDITLIARHQARHNFRNCQKND